MSICSNTPKEPSINSSLMQNFHIAMPVSANTEIASVYIEKYAHVFSLGTDKKVYSFTQDPDSDTGWTQLNTNFNQTYLNAVFSENVLFAYGVDNKGNLTRITFPSDKQPQQEIVNPPKGTQKIKKILAFTCALQPEITMLFTIASKNNYLMFGYVMSNDWQPKAKWEYIKIQKKKISIQKIIFTNNANKKFALACIDTDDFICTADQIDTDWTTLKTLKVKDIALAADKKNNFHLFAIDMDGYLRHTTKNTTSASSQKNKWGDWEQLDGTKKLTGLQADTNNLGELEVFAIDATNKQLCHIHQDADAASGWTTLVNIGDNVEHFSLLKNPAGHTHLMYVNTANDLYHAWQDPETTDWNETKVERESPNTVEEINTYATEITVFNDSGNPAPNTDVNLWTGDKDVTINNSFHIADSMNPIKCKTNIAGKLSVVCETDSLYTSIFKLQIGDGDYQDIEANDWLQEKLAAITGDDLLDAKDTDGQSIITDPEYRTAESAKHLAAGISAVMSLTPNKNKGVPQREFQASYARKIDPELIANSKSWIMDFKSGKPVFKELTDDEAESLAQEYRAKFADATVDLDWGDVWEGVRNGVTHFHDVVFQKDAGLLITIVINGVEYLFEKTLDFVEQCFDLAEGFFSRVKVEFEKLFEWLGFIFDREDILRTHDAATHSIYETLDFIPDCLDRINELAQDGIAEIKSHLDQDIKSAIDKIGNYSITSLTDQYAEPLPQKIERILQHNIILSTFINNIASASIKGSNELNLPLQIEQAFQDVIDKLKQYAEDCQTTDAFTNAVNYFSQIKDEPEKFLQLALSGLLSLVNGVSDVTLDTATIIINAINACATSIITAITESLDAEWDIPVITDIYSYITKGEPLKAIDLFALMIAVPTTAIYKEIYNEAPFADEDSVDQFKDFFTTEELLKASGLTLNSKIKTGSPKSKVWLENSKTIFQVLYACSYFVWAGYEPILDLIPDKEAETTSALILSGGLIIPLCHQIFSIPWPWSHQTPSCNTAKGLEALIWCLQLLPLTADAITLKTGQILLRHFIEGPAINSIWGVIHLSLFVILACKEDWSDLIDQYSKTAKNVLSTMPAIGKFGKLTDDLKLVVGADAAGNNSTWLLTLGELCLLEN
jgi:hypothetical protein